MTSSRARISRRAFVAGLGASAAACTPAKLVTTAYPIAAKCAPTKCTRVDIHCHVFNASDLNTKGFISHILPVPKRWTDALLGALSAELNARAPSASEELAALALIHQTVVAPKLPEVSGTLKGYAASLTASAAVSSGVQTVGDVADTLGLIVRPRREIAATLVQTYAQIDLFTPALVDYSYWSKDAPESDLASQIAVQAELSNLSLKGFIGHEGARIHPFAPFNPLREVREVIERLEPGKAYAPLGASKPYACDLPTEETEVPGLGALAVVRYAVEKLGFVGAKVYPPIGYLPIGNATWVHHQQDTKLGPALDLALRAFYAYCEAEQVPVMTHANNSNGYDLGYGLLTGPDGWEDVLREYPRLRLNLGHFGALEGDSPERGIQACELWMRKIADLMERYPNVYADVGCSLVPVEQDYQDRYLRLLDDLFVAYPKSKLRLMYGSDFWLNRLSANADTFVNAFDYLFEKHFPAIRDDFLGANALRFLGIIDDDGKPASLNRNRLRLQARYEGIEKPAWLA